MVVLMHVGAVGAYREQAEDTSQSQSARQTPTQDSDTH
jgi:hypothetical protein